MNSYADKPRANKYINGETVNYSVCFFAASFLFIVFKQLFKLFLGLSAPIAVGISAGICAVVLFFLENKFVFYNGKNHSTVKKILYYIFRCAVDVGFYKIASYLFCDMLGTQSALAFIICGIALYFFNYYFGKILVFDSPDTAEKKANGRCFKLFWRNRYVLTSVLITSGVFLIISFILGIFPFGDVTILRMDLYHQYGPLYTELFDRLVEGKSFLYSWRSGGGSGFLGNFFNYLSSPLSFIILLFDRDDMPHAINMFFYFKGLLCAATFTYYIKHSLKQHSIITASFGTLYTFCAYYLAYYWNIMWIDGMILFPLVVLGIERIINKGKPLTYIISLTVLFFASYYMAYMVCLFAVIYFFAYYILKFDDHIEHTEQQLARSKEKASPIKKILQNRLINRGLIFAGASILSAALCAVTLIPVYSILQGSSATTDKFPSNFESYFDILNIVSSHLIGLETTIRSSGEDVLPNIFCGIITVLLLPIYMSNRKIRVREKAVYVFLILFFIFSFDNNCMNFIWHAFHFPNDLPYRFSFMYSFILLVVAIRAFTKLKYNTYGDIAFSGMVWVFVILVIQKFPTEKMSELNIYVSLGFIMAWTAILLAIRNGKLDKALINIFMSSVIIFEAVLATNISYKIILAQEDYLEKYPTVTEAVDYVHDHDNGFYKTELTELKTRMDPCLYGYDGISTFSSMAYQNYSAQQKNIGMYGNNINSYTYHPQTPIYNMMYSIKYLIKVEESQPLSEDYYTYLSTTNDGKADIYENKYYMPIAFEVSSDIDSWSSDYENPFEAQQDFLTNAAGVGDIFIPAEFTNTEYYETGGEEVTENGTYYYTKNDPESETGSIDVTIKAVRDGDLYLCINSPEIENGDVYLDGGEEIHLSLTDPYIMDLGWHSAGDEVTVSLECGESDQDSSYFDIYAYNIDKEAFDDAYQLLSLGAIDVTEFSDTKISGTVNAGYNGVLYTSIPYDEGWSIYIDGEKAPLVSINGCQLGCEIAQGEHTVTFKFFPRGLKEGALISAAAIVCSATWIILAKKRKIKGNC